MIIISPFLSFPSVGWWLHVANASHVMIDGHEHYQKMTDRNRYRVSGANNNILLSVPLAQGRSQRLPMVDVAIANDTRWQTQHWRTLVSVYNRSPYFFHYHDSLKVIFDTAYPSLCKFNRASIDWAMQQLKLKVDLSETDTYRKEYMSGYKDLRGYRKYEATYPRYYQIFEDRLGFVPDLSILDLLFSEGPAAGGWIGGNAIKY